METLNLECAESLSLNQRCDFWGENINYRNVEDYSVRGRLRTYTNTSAPLWSGISGFYPFITGDQTVFIINNVNLGTGKVTSFSTEGGADISNKVFDIGFQILKAGDFRFMTGQLYSGYSNKSFFPYLNSFSENFDYSQDNNRTVNFNRNVDIEFERGFSGFFGATSQVLDALADFGIYHPVQPVQFWSGNGIKIRNNTWDEINSRFSYSESYAYQSGLPYVWDYGHNLSFGQNGVTTASEQGKITASMRTGEKIEFARSGWAIVQTGIFGRISDFYSRWSGAFNSTCPFSGDPNEKSVTVNNWVGSIDYAFTYSNDQSNYSGYNWSYENSISQDVNGWAEVSENGSLRAKSSATGQIDFLISRFSGVEAGIGGRISGIYNQTIPFFRNAACVSGFSGSLTETAQEKTYTERPASIDYNFNYTNDPSFFATGNFYQVKSTYNDNQPVHLTNFFNIANYREIAQGSNQSTLGTLSNQIEIVGRTGVSIAQYLARANQEMRLPSGVSFVSDEKYSFDPFSRQFSLNRDYVYSKYRALSDYSI